MKRSYSGYLYIVLCAVIFSTMEVMLKTVHGVFAPMQITCLRFLIGGLLLVPFALRSMKKKGAAFTRADVGFFALTGFLCVAFSMVLYQMAVTYTKASVVAIIFSCNPIFVTMLAYFLLREEIHRNHLIALALELLGTGALARKHPSLVVDPTHWQSMFVAAGIMGAAVPMYNIVIDTRMPQTAPTDLNVRHVVEIDREMLENGFLTGTINICGHTCLCQDGYTASALFMQSLIAKK